MYSIFQTHMQSVYVTLYSFIAVFLHGKFAMLLDSVLKMQMIHLNVSQMKDVFSCSKNLGGGGVLFAI